MPGGGGGGGGGVHSWPMKAAGPANIVRSMRFKHEIGS